MTSAFLWELFLDTGAPEVYLLYKKSLERQPDAASA